MSLALALLGGWRGLALAVLAAALLSAAVWRAGQVKALRADLAVAARRVAALEADLAATARRARNLEIRDHAHALAQDRLAPVEIPNFGIPNSGVPNSGDSNPENSDAGDGAQPVDPDGAAQRLRDLCAADPHCRG